MQDYIEVESYGKVFPKKGANNRMPYAHQKGAMENLNIINASRQYSTMIVLPTGGGKTYTMSMWLLKNALDQKKKILWIAHRQMLLDQAAESFQKFAYSEVIPHIPFFQYRIISGASCHDRMIDIQATDNLLIISKDSAGRDLAVHLSDIPLHSESCRIVPAMLPSQNRFLKATTQRNCMEIPWDWMAGKVYSGLMYCRKI